MHDNKLIVCITIHDVRAFRFSTYRLNVLIYFPRMITPLVCLKLETSPSAVYSAYIVSFLSNPTRTRLTQTRSVVRKLRRCENMMTTLPLGDRLVFSFPVLPETIVQCGLTTDLLPSTRKPSHL